MDGTVPVRTVSQLLYLRQKEGIKEKEVSGDFLNFPSRKKVARRSFQRTREVAREVFIELYAYRVTKFVELDNHGEELFDVFFFFSSG